MNRVLVSLLLSTAMAVATSVVAQPLPGDSVYHVAASTRDSTGKTFDWRELRGQAQIVSMLYTHCPMMCPLIMENAKNVQHQLSADERPRLGFAMISLDPVRDTPEVMREARRKHRLPDDWKLLTPSEADVRAIANVLDVKYRFRADGSINHTSVLVLLDAQGRIRARSEVTGALPDPTFMMQINALLQGQ